MAQQSMCVFLFVSTRPGALAFALFAQRDIGQVLPVEVVVTLGLVYCEALKLSDVTRFHLNPEDVAYRLRRDNWYFVSCPVDRLKQQGS